MNRKLVFIFYGLTFFTLILALVLGLGFLQDSQEGGEYRFVSFLRGRLQEIKVSMEEQVSRWENDLLLLTDQLDLSNEELRALPRENSLIRGLFVLDLEGELIFPDEENLGQKELEFLERTESLWERGFAFSLVTESRNQTYGWRKWYWQEGDQHIFWRLKENMGIVGMELDRYGLLSQMITQLPSESWDEGDRRGHRIELVDMHKGLFYQWGALEGEEEALTQVSLTGPWSGWELRYFLDPGLLGSGQELAYLALIFGVLALGISLAAAGFQLLSRMGRSMEEARQKINFVNQVSHELKTPLTNICLYSELLETRVSSKDKKSAQYLKVIVDESQRLGRLIHNVLSFGKKSQPSLSFQEILPDQIILKVLSLHEPALKAKDLETHLELGAEKSMVLDPDVLEQILGNLVSNVEKYAWEGGLLGLSSTQEERVLVIRVWDRGTGIPKKEGERIFEPFLRLHTKVQDGQGGTGIGLTISRDLARRHGGDLFLEERTEGSQFCLRLREEEINE